MATPQYIPRGNSRPNTNKTAVRGVWSQTVATAVWSGPADGTSKWPTLSLLCAPSLTPAQSMPVSGARSLTTALCRTVERARNRLFALPVCCAHWRGGCARSGCGCGTFDAGWIYDAALTGRQISRSSSFRGNGYLCSNTKKWSSAHYDALHGHIRHREMSQLGTFWWCFHALKTMR